MGVVVLVVMSTAVRGRKESAMITHRVKVWGETGMYIYVYMCMCVLEVV